MKTFFKTHSDKIKLVIGILPILIIASVPITLFIYQTAKLTYNLIPSVAWFIKEVQIFLFWLIGFMLVLIVFAGLKLYSYKKIQS